MTNKQDNRYQFSLGHQVKDIDRIEFAMEDLKSQWEVNEKTIFNLNLVLEEIISNTMFYGFVDKEEGEIKINLNQANDYIQVQVEDNATEFDPTSESKALPGGSLDDREIGGLGLMLSQQISEDMRHQRKGDWNSLTFKIKINND